MTFHRAGKACMRLSVAGEFIVWNVTTNVKQQAGMFQEAWRDFVLLSVTSDTAGQGYQPSTRPVADLSSG